MASGGMVVVPGQVVNVETTGDRLIGVRLHDDSVVALDVLAVPSHTIARPEGMTGPGLETEENSMSNVVVTDPAGRTSVPDVWAAGNIAAAWR